VPGTVMSAVAPWTVNDWVKARLVFVIEPAVSVQRSAMNATSMSPVVNSPVKV